MTDQSTQLKQQAAEYAVDQYIQSNMIIGLGVGSTAIFAVRHIAHKLKAGTLHNILAIPCAKQVEQAAHELEIPLTTLEDHPEVEVTIDGADEVDDHLNVIKGGGGALLREKIVAQSTRTEVIIVDESKISHHLGEKWAVPIEVIPFGWGAQAHFLKQIGGDPVLRRQQDGSLYYTDQGNLIMDCNFGVIADPHALARQLERRAGIVEHGLFLGLVAAVIVARPGSIETIQRR